MTEGRKEGWGGRDGDREGYGGGVALASTPDEEGRGRRRRKKKVLARLKKLGRPLKTIRLMKYVKAHKETLRPFKGVRRGGGGARSWGKLTESASSGERERDTRKKKGRKQEQAQSIRISWDVKRETRRRRRGARKISMWRERGGWKRMRKR